ncbi:MAG TPA: MFS transporter [Candidatus Saccharimonadales bacterium]|nr:MFS transporter [Candidatus Saccharimonadales bacterium]
MDQESAPAPFVKKWAPLFVMGLAVIIIVLDTTLLNVSLGTIVRNLHTDIQSLQWVITAYALTLAALTITGGRFGDLFGRKRMFMAGAAIFAIGSFIASISQNVGMLIIGEAVIEGIGAALMMPATASLLVTAYRGRDRALALGIWGGMAAAGSAIGPVVGGFLTSHYSWRWGFRINVFVAALLLIGSVLITEARDTEERPSIDWLGVALSATGLTSLVFAIIESSTYGWWRALQVFHVGGWRLSLGGFSVVPAALLLGTLLLLGFFFWEQYLTARRRTPLVSMKLFANKQFTSGAMLMAVMAIGQVGLIFGLPVFLQGVRGMDALHTGYALLPMSVGLFIMAPLGGYLAKHFRPKYIVQVGLFVNIAALLVLRQVLSVTAGDTVLLAPLLVYGMGIGLMMSQLSNITLSAVSPQESGEASGVNNTLRQVGQSLGTALIGTILIASITNGMVDRVANSPAIADANRTALTQTVRAQSSNIEFGIPITGEHLSPEEAAELKTIADESTVEANKEALLYTAIFTALAFLVAAQLPSVQLHRLEKSESLAVH